MTGRPTRNGRPMRYVAEPEQGPVGKSGVSRPKKRDTHRGQLWSKVEELLVKHPGPFYGFPFFMVGVMVVSLWIKYGFRS